MNSNYSKLPTVFSENDLTNCYSYLSSRFNHSLPENFFKFLILHKLKSTSLRLQRKMRVLTAALCLMDSTKK